ncbi:MAG TPA: DUF177 domain-containing protein [Hyphomicrobiales bacterium]|nr:DUF177 domain-containing protein [Hyphomicrobiales bacterium]
MATDLPFSRPVVAAAVPEDGREVHLEADAAERAALAAFLDLPGIARLEADLRLSRWRDGLAVGGTLDAVVTRVCVVSLEPFEAEIHEPVEARFGTAASAGARIEGSGVEGEPKGSHAADLDAPEPLVDGRADLGQLVAEFLALGLDPYPHAPGVAFEPPTEEDARGGAFAALARLRGERDKR